MSAPTPTAASQSQRDLAQLIRSAKSWMVDALNAWTEDNHAKVSAAAPLAVELLGKAVLWQKNPVLVTPLQADAEATLLVLATEPKISDPRLRTVGLKLLLSRLRSLLGGLPVGDTRCKRLVDVRNGAMHIGSSEESEKVLADALILCNSLLKELGKDERSFYGGHHYPSVNKLIDQTRTDFERRVDAKRARARRHLVDLKRGLNDDDLYRWLLMRREAEAADTVVSVLMSPSVWAIDADCPECTSRGRLHGKIEVDQEIDVDVEPLGNGQYRSSPVGVAWHVTLDPEGFECRVCTLTLSGTEELAVCGLPDSRIDVEPADLGEDFDPALASEVLYGID